MALLAAVSRITESILAKQLDDYQENNKLVHKGVHGFRRERGTNTAMLETWEFVLEKTEKGELVALDFLDISAGFDTMIHLYLLRKMEVEVGMGEKSLKWLSSYLKNWLQYVVVGASSSTTRRMTKGAPQGGGLSPILWRSYTNVIPEAGLQRAPEEEVGGAIRIEINPKTDQGVISQNIDSKTVLSTEEKLDQKMRSEGVWNLEMWRQQRTEVGGQGDELKQKKTEEVGDVVTSIYADDTQSRTSAKTKQELEMKNSRGLTVICRELKALRLKVNEDKTTYMVLGTQGRRAREDLTSEIEVCGEKVKSSDTGMCLGLLVSNNLTWRHQVEKIVKSCNSKQNGLWKCTNILNKGQRKSKAEGIILSRLNYCIELVSQGRKADLERLQSTQSKAARWVLQTRRTDWSLRGGLRKLGWLSMAQQAAYVSIKTALKILQKCEPERLYSLLTEEKDGIKVRRVVNEKKFKKLKATTRKAWSYRSLRWLEQLPEVLRRRDVKLKATQKELRQWVKHHVPVRGDRILWGKPLAGETRRRRSASVENGDEGPEPGDLGTHSQQETHRDEAVRPGVGGEPVVTAGSYHDPTGHQIQMIMKIRWSVLLLVLLEPKKTTQIPGRVTCVGSSKGNYCQSPVRRKKEMWKMMLYNDPRCGGHRGGVGRVKSGEG